MPSPDAEVQGGESADLAEAIDLLRRAFPDHGPIEQRKDWWRRWGALMDRHTPDDAATPVVAPADVTTKQADPLSKAAEA